MKKLPAMFWVGLTTVVLVMITIMVAMNLPFNWVFYTTVSGQVLVAVMVYKVLTDDYTTDKTFENLYEDKPINYRQ